MLCRADSIGVFQVESRAQMTMLPRLKPREFYDLVIEVAIVRPGPDPGRHGASLSAPPRGEGGGRVPLARRCARCSARPCGVPLFQEQAMKIAIVGAGFTARGGRPAAPRHGDLQAQRRDPSVPREVHRRHARQRLRPISRPAASTRSRGSATTASPKATPRASRCWSMSRPGSSASIPRSSPARCSTASRWASTRRRRSSATRASMASRCARSMSISATGTARWSRLADATPLQSLFVTRHEPGLTRPSTKMSTSIPGPTPGADAIGTTRMQRRRAQAQDARCASACASQGARRSRCRAARRGARRRLSRRAAICGAGAGSAAPHWNASPRPMRCAR